MRRGSATLALPAFLLACALGALAADEPPSEPWKTREYPEFHFSLAVPADWADEVHESGVKWDSPSSALAGEVQVFVPRRDLDGVERNLRAKAASERWTLVDDPRRAEVGGRPAFLLVADVPREKVARELLVVIDAPNGTYLLHYGDAPGAFDRALLDRVVASFKLLPSAAAPAPASPTADPTGAYPPPARFGCKACGRLWPEWYKYCGDCGAKTTLVPDPDEAKDGQAKRWGCAPCGGRDWPAEQRFCGECGARNGPL